MAEETINALAVFDNGYELNYLEKGGEILFTAEEIGKHLGYGDPAKAISNLFQRNHNELKLYSSILKVRESNNYKELRVFTEEGVYIISMLARTNEAKKFRARVALLLRRLRQEALQRQVELAREAGYRQGRDEARALPAMREQARLIWALGPARKRRLRSVVRWRSLGLGVNSIAKLLDTDSREISFLLKAARGMGLLPEKAASRQPALQQGVLI